MTHAPLPPSASSRWIACPGSVAFTRDLTSPDNEASIYGTRMHLVASQLLESGQPVATALGTTVDGHVVTQEDLDMLQDYCDHVRILELVHSGELMVEQRVRLSDLCWGTADALVWAFDGRSLHVVDLKTGGSEVTVHMNTQLLIYAGAALRAFPDRAARVVEVGLHIVQPRRGGTSSWVISRAELDGVIGSIEAAAEATQAPDAPLVAGDHCTWCPGAATCPALHQRALAVASSVFTQGLAAPASTPPSPVQLTDAELAVVLDAEDLLTSWLSRVRTEAERRLQAGGTVPGWKLIEKQGNRAWLDEARVEVYLRSLGIDPHEKSLRSPASVERVAKAAKLRVDLAPLVTRPTRVALAPESHTSPAVRPAFAPLPVD